MKRKLLIRDVTLRDGQQSLFATRMTQQQVERVLSYFRDAGFYAMEVWGGAVPDSVMRYLNEDPWGRLESIKAVIGDASKLTALSRGRNLFGYNPYPEEVIEGFNKNAVQSGISIMRIFDALNDTDNIRSTVKYVKESGGLADCTVCYTVDPKFSTKDRIIAKFSGKSLPKRIFTEKYYIQKAKELEAMGADMITLKDMAGLVTPEESARIISALKSEVKVPIDFHTHCTPGYGLASTLIAIINGVDIVDTAIWNFAGGPAAPAFELVQIFCDKLGVETGINLNAVSIINKELKQVRAELKGVDNYELPLEFDIANFTLPARIDNLFEKAILFAQAGKYSALLEACQEIERYFNFPAPDENVKHAEIPGGMYTNMLAQLKQLKLEKLLPRVLEIIPSVRLDAGCPPLVTPTSQIVGAQAVNCAIDESKGVSFYTNKSIQYVNLVKGVYGKTPQPVDPEFRMKIAGVREETPYNTANYKKQPNPTFPEYGKDIKLAVTEKEELLLELFPQVAEKYLRDKVMAKYEADRQRRLEAERAKVLEEKRKYEAMTEQEKLQRLLDGLENYFS
ncbi:MAG: carboxylase [Bacteroidales bacterium]